MKMLLLFQVISLIQIIENIEILIGKTIQNNVAFISLVISLIQSKHVALIIKYLAQTMILPTIT